MQTLPGERVDELDRVADKQEASARCAANVVFQAAGEGHVIGRRRRDIHGSRSPGN